MKKVTLFLAMVFCLSLFSACEPDNINENDGDQLIDKNETVRPGDQDPGGNNSGDNDESNNGG